MKPTWEFLLLGMLLLSGCAVKHHHIFTTDADILDKLGYHGEHRAVYVIGSDKCYTNDDTKPYPQADFKCF